MNQNKETSYTIEAIKNYCTDNNISFAEIGRRTGYTPQQISRFLSNKHDTGITVLEKICDSIKLDICFKAYK